jgi:CBS domain-containing protein
MPARDIMMGDVLTVAATASLLDAAKIMIHGDVSGLPVADAAGRVVGMLSEVDVIR